MFPEAEDNYGTDSCSILCLHPLISSPPVLVIATNGGTLYHCVVLSRGGGGNGDTVNEDDDAASQISEWTHFNESDLALHVYESVELDIAFFNNRSAATSEDKAKRPFDYPIHLESDPTSPARYFCSHAGGVHAVGLPMVTKLAEMASSGGEAADTTISCLQGQDPSVVEHLICTQLSATSKPSPVLGLALHYPPAQLICLLSDFSIQTVALSPPYFASPPPLASATSPLGSNKGRKTQESQECSFEEVIRRTLLKKSSTHPMMRAAPAVGKADVEKEEMLDIVAKSTQTLREEYLNRLERARSDIERRVAHLRAQKQSQAASL